MKIHQIASEKPRAKTRQTAVSRLPRIHFTAPYLLAPTNPITVRLIGAGGTGSHMLTALVKLHAALIALEHPGLLVQLWDDDTVSQANMARQLFAPGEVGQYKAAALINRANRFMGTNWKAIPGRFTYDPGKPVDHVGTNLTITCVDTLKARREVAAYLGDITSNAKYQYSQRTNGPGRCYYWLDSGNAQKTGQVILSTVGQHPQRKTKLFQTVARLPGLMETYENELEGTPEDTSPSCSVADALSKQDLFINSTLATMAGSLLWTMLREAQTAERGFFLNLGGFRSQPLLV